MSYRSLYLATALLAATACSKADGGAPAPTPSPSPGSAAPAVAVVANGSGSAASTDTAKQVAPSQDLRQLGSRLNYESLHRPTIGPTAEQVFASLDKSGIKLGNMSQYAGSTMGAAFCAGGQTSAGLVAAVCEYPTPEAAVAGKKFMDDRFKGTALPQNRHARRGTVLTLTGNAPNEITKPAFAAFDSL